MSIDGEQPAAIRKSPASHPGFLTGRPSPNKGKKLPSEELTPGEVSRLLRSFGTERPAYVRDRAIATLLYRTGMKLVQIGQLDRRYYKEGDDRLTVPDAARLRGGQVLLLDRETREALEAWTTVRRKLAVGPAAPLFCSTVENVGKPYEPSAFRESLRRRGRKLGIDKKVAPESLRLSGDMQLTNPRWSGTRPRPRAGLRKTAPGVRPGIQSLVEDYVRSSDFAKRYPEALDKWEEGRELFSADPIRHSKTIGFACREALELFAKTVVNQAELDLHLASDKTVDRLRALMEYRAHQLGTTVTPFLHALLDYWGCVSDLAQRQVHGGGKEYEALTKEDGRRVIFQTMLVMYEVDRSLGVAVQ